MLRLQGSAEKGKRDNKIHYVSRRSRTTCALLKAGTELNFCSACAFAFTLVAQIKVNMVNFNF